MTDRLIRDVVRDAVARLAPDELDDFELVVRTFEASPDAARRGVRVASAPRDEATGFGVELAAQALSSLAMAVALDVSKDLVKEGGKSVWRWWRVRRAAPAPTDATPVLAEGDRDRAVTTATASATALGASPAQADAVARAVIDCWTAPVP